MQGKDGVTCLLSQNRRWKLNKPSALFLCLLGMREKLSQFLIDSFTSHRTPKYTAFTCSAFGLDGLERYKGRDSPLSLPYPCTENPASCNWIVSFVSIFERALVNFARREVKTHPTSQRGNENYFWAKCFIQTSVTSASAKVSGFLRKLFQKHGELSRE